jgi:hypothetical protein
MSYLQRNCAQFHDTSSMLVLDDACPVLDRLLRSLAKQQHISSRTAVARILMDQPPQ